MICIISHLFRALVWGYQATVLSTHKQIKAQGRKQQYHLSGTGTAAGKGTAAQSPGAASRQLKPQLYPSLALLTGRNTWISASLLGIMGLFQKPPKLLLKLALSCSSP